MSANIFRQVSAASTNLTRIKQFGANLIGGIIINTNAAIRYVKLYWFLPGGPQYPNSNSGDTPTVGTTPVSLTLEIPASGQLVLDQVAQGVSMKGDLWMATTVNAVDSDATAVGAGDLITQLFVE